MTSSPATGKSVAVANARPGGTEYSVDAIMTAANATAYYWDLTSDRIIWARNATSVLNLDDICLARTGTDYDTLVRDGLVGSRRDAIVGLIDDRNQYGTPYSIVYRFGTDANGEPMWVEDHGRWQTNEDGTPKAARGIVHIITEQHIQKHRYDVLFRNDRLAQFNRAELYEAVSDTLMKAREDHSHHAFVLIGINNLVSINEAFGYSMGDEVITLVGQRLRGELREEDIIGRFSSNKFGLLLENVGAQAMGSAAERLLRSVRDEVIETSLGPVAVAISIGGVQIPLHGDTAAQVIGHAEEALAQARAKPHDIFVAYEVEENKVELRRRNREIADELFATLREQRLLLALQPIVHADTLQPAIHECLLRIRRPDGAIISAGAYVPVAERLGLVRFLDYRVLEMAIDVARAHTDLTLTVNVSGLTTNDRVWFELFRSLTDGDTSLTSRLIIEITETAAISDIDESVRFVSRIKDLGCRVAMDDFGSGYSSFRNLRRLGLDMVKIDGSFIENMRNNRDDRLFVTMLSKLALEFGLDVVAENVADDETIQLLRDAGVTYLQGFHLGEPVLAEL